MKKESNSITSRKRLGLIVNPISGMGGRVGLKGTDGREILEKALALGAAPVSPGKAIEALTYVACVKDRVEVVTYPFEMGEYEVRQSGMDPVVIGSITQGNTTATDTKNAAKQMAASVVLILFAGGDGTARDIYEAVGQEVPALGIPAGVKIHSAAFAVNAKRAGELAVKFIEGEARLREAEIVDIDEDAFRKGRVSARLYGYLKVPYERAMVQGVKGDSSILLDEKKSQEGIAEYFIQTMDDSYYILGPGTTVKAISEKLGIDKTLLGVDVIHKGRLVAMDLNEEQLLKLIKGKRTKIVVSPIGGQGFIFGRGNQQISQRVITQVGRESIIVVATNNKLLSIGVGRPLLVDTGDEQTDKMLLGYIRVIIGYNEETVIKIST